MPITIKYLITAAPKANPDHVVVQELASQQQRDRWVELLKQNNWKVIKKETKVVRI